MLVDVLSFWAIAVAVVTFLRLFYLYLSIALKSSGVLRAKSVAIGIGLILPLIVLLLSADFVPSIPDLSYVVTDVFYVFSAYLLYWGLR
jgi:hypothetical protein